jgi:O-acetyl-ADP-ribose deacetylase
MQTIQNADTNTQRIEVLAGDITKLTVTTIVNAANVTLLGGGGVDGAIHRAAGPELLEECESIGGCPTGEVRPTKGYRLPAKWVFHAVGPVYQGGSHGEAELLKSCYANALRLAEELQCESIAFPCISTGIYRFPKQHACQIATETVIAWLKDHALPAKVVFCCFENEDVALYRAALRGAKG